MSIEKQIEDKQSELKEAQEKMSVVCELRDNIKTELDLLVSKRRYNRFMQLVEMVRKHPELVDLLTPEHQYTSKSGCDDILLDNRYRCLRCNLLANLEADSYLVELDDMHDFALEMWK